MYGQRLSLRDGKYLEDNLRGLSYNEGEHQLSNDDCNRCAFALTLWLLALGDIASSYDLERTFSMANLIRWSDRPKLDMKVLLDEAKECLAVIRDYDPFQGRVGFRAYKAWLTQRLCCNSVYELLRPLFHLLYGGRADVFRDLNTLLQFWSRLTLTDADWLEDDMLDKYITLESQMASWVYPSTTVDCLRYIVTEWLMDFEIDGLKPEFSNGATAEVKRGAGVAQKVMRCHRTIDLALADAMISFNSPYYPQFELQDDLRAVWRVVPKGIDKKRGISMEPTVKQYYQYALFKGLDQHFIKHPEMGINLENQDLSRQMCLDGSITCQYSTIDLSSASDTVTWALVKELLRDLPDMLRYIEYVRTSKVELPDGNVISMAKFAPMGSSLCFPIECIVFASIASYACWLSGIPQNFRVYGDDIVIDSRAFQKCCELLVDMHFEVNIDKSYGPWSHFTEACGMEAYFGVDVTPCRISRRFDIIKLRSGKSPQQLNGSIEFANRLYDYGLFKCRRYLVRNIMDHYRSVPFSCYPEKGIYHPCPDNFHLKSRWEHDLQCTQVQIIRTCSTVASGGDDIRYLRTLEAIDTRVVEMESAEYNGYRLLPEDVVKVSCGSTRDSFRKEWVSLWDLVD